MPPPTAPQLALQLLRSADEQISGGDSARA
jgi:hypothetical protein